MTGKGVAVALPLLMAANDARLLLDIPANKKGRALAD